VFGEAPDTHPVHVQWRHGGEPGQQVGAGDPAPAHRLVDEHGEPLQLARVPVARVRDAVFDDGGTGATGVPEQLIEVRDVHQHHVVPVGHRVPGVGHVHPRRVVFQVDHG
jgi:hypothetical protein